MHTSAGLIRSAALLLCVPATAVCQAGSGDTNRWFEFTTQALYDAVAAGDKAVWDRVLDEKCLITTEDGEVLDRQGFLKDLQPLPPGFEGSIKVRDLTVRTLGDAAVVHYWLDEVEAIFGQRLQTTYVDTDIYRRTPAGWKVVAMQATVVPRDLEPVPADSSTWPALVGDYRYSDKTTSRYRVFLKEGALYGGRDAASATPLIPLSPLVFFQKGSIHIMVFVRDTNGAITEVRELHKYNEVRMQRVSAAPG